MRLMQSGCIGAMTVKNRVVMAAMGIRGMVEPDGGRIFGTVLGDMLLGIEN